MQCPPSTEQSANFVSTTQRHSTGRLVSRVLSAFHQRRSWGDVKLAKQYSIAYVPYRAIQREYLTVIEHNLSKTAS